MTSIDGRTRHYGEFYGIGHSGSTEPLCLVLGNCQAEALRQVLGTAPDTPFRTIRMPPVHELDERDITYLRSAAATASLLLSQPIRTGYRGLPIGTADVEKMLPAGAQTVRWPVLRYAGLHPFQAIARHPGDPSAVPDLAPYHDLRTVAACVRGDSPDAPWDVEISAEAIREVGNRSIAELARREARDTDVGVSDALRSFGADAAHTINHPGNRVLELLASRVLTALDVASPIGDVGRVLLGSVTAPLEQRVLDAIDSDRPARVDWQIGGADVSPDTVHRTHMRWYAEHPEFIDAVVDRHGETMDLLGLTRP